MRGPLSTFVLLHGWDGSFGSKTVDEHGLYNVPISIVALNQLFSSALSKDKRHILDNACISGHPQPSDRRGAAVDADQAARPAARQ